MSAYGTVTIANRPVGRLPQTTWDLPQSTPGKPTAPFHRLVLHHLRLESARASPAGPSLLEYTHRIFAAEVEAGRTYPQEADVLAAVPAAVPAVAATAGSTRSADTDTDTRAHATQAYTRTAFEAYFWAADVIVAIGRTDEADDGGSDGGRVQAQNVRSGSGDLLEISRGGRSWEDALVGFYYVKPNYPGRSSHVSVCFVPCMILRYLIYFTLDARSHADNGLGRFATQVLLSALHTGNSDMERLWASRTCIMVPRSDTKQAFSIWSMQITQEV
jgi:hypothetical protein